MRNGCSTGRIDRAGHVGNERPQEAVEFDDDMVRLKYVMRRRRGVAVRSSHGPGRSRVFGLEAGCHASVSSAERNSQSNAANMPDTQAVQSRRETSTQSHSLAPVSEPTVEDDEKRRAMDLIHLLNRPGLCHITAPDSSCEHIFPSVAHSLHSFPQISSFPSWDVTYESAGTMESSVHFARCGLKAYLRVHVRLASTRVGFVERLLT